MNNIREICAKRSEWKSEYNSNGRRIDVDVPIVIPDVKKIPVISVKPYYAVNGQCLVSRVEPMEKIGEEGCYSVYEDCELLSYMGEEQTERGKVEVLDLDDYERAGMLVDYSAPFNKQNSKTKYTNEIFYPYERELSSVYAEDNPISLEEAIKYLEKIETAAEIDAAADDLVPGLHERADGKVDGLAAAHRDEDVFFLIMQLKPAL